MEKTVYFRTFEESDADLIYQWMNDDELKKLSIGLNRRMCHEEALNWIISRKEHNQYSVFWAICAKDTNKLIGWANIVDIHYVNRTANFGGIMICDKEYRDGMAWIETFLFVYEYVFERLNLNRLFGSAILEQKASVCMGIAMHEVFEGIARQEIFKNGDYKDVVYMSILQKEYFSYKEVGDFEIPQILLRLKGAKIEYNNILNYAKKRH